MIDLNIKKENSTNKKKYTEIQRVAGCLGLTNDLNDEFLYSKVATEISKLKKENNKAKFMNVILKDKIHKYELKLKNVDNKNIDDFELINNLQNKFNETFNVLKKENKELNTVLFDKDKEITYLENRLKEEINKNKTLGKEELLL